MKRDPAVELTTVEQADKSWSESRGTKNKENASSNFGGVTKTSRGARRPCLYGGSQPVSHLHGGNSVGCSMPDQKQERRECRARSPTRCLLVESTNPKHSSNGRRKKLRVRVTPVARGTFAARGVSLVWGRTVFHRGATQSGCKGLMGGQLPEPSGPAYNSLHAALQASAELAPAAPADIQGQYVPAWRSIQTDVQSGFTKEGIAADDCNKWCLGDLFVVGAQRMAVCYVTAILDTGSGLTTASARATATLQANYPHVNLIAPMEDSQQVRVANGHVRHVIEKTCLVRVALHTSWGPVMMDLFSFAVMPGTDGDNSLGNPTMKARNIDIYEHG